MAARGKKAKKRATGPRREKLVRKKSRSHAPKPRRQKSALKSGKSRSDKSKSDNSKSRKSKSGKSGSATARLRRELSAARDRQTASADILRAIANSPADAERALHQIAETTARLFGAPASPSA